jgi:hypothetical protein
VLPPLLVGLLALPFILWQNSWWEWATPFWLLQRQAAHVSAHGVPTLFLHTASGAFNPFYAFYGGFTLSALAYPAAAIGAWPVIVAATEAAMVGGYLGIWWTARNLGLSHRLAVLPPLTFSTTPYLLSDLYGRGAWAEFLAVNAAAVVLGAATGRPRRRSDRPWGGAHRRLARSEPLARAGYVDRARVAERRPGEPASFSIRGLMTQYQFRVVGRPVGDKWRITSAPMHVNDMTTADAVPMQGIGKAGQRANTGVVWYPLLRIEADAHRGRAQSETPQEIRHAPPEDVRGTTRAPAG